jgi:hypothetical protein
MGPPPPKSAPPKNEPAAQDPPLSDPPPPAAESSAPAAETSPPASASAPGSRQIREAVLTAWAEAFGAPVKPGDGFVKLGGDPPTAVAIADSVQASFDVELDLRVFDTDITPTALAALVDQHRGNPTVDGLPPLRRARRMFPLSSAQERVWRPRTFAENPSASHSVVVSRLKGPLDIRALRAGIEEMVRRHEILRTTFVEYGDRPVGVVRAAMPLEFEVDELREADDGEARAERLLAQEQERPFDLEQGPLHRWRVLRMGGAEFRLLWSVHHLIHDPLVPTVFFRELATVYETLRAGDQPAAAAPRPALQYADYAVWEQAALRSGSRAYRQQLDWWRKQFATPVAPLQLPFAREPAAGAQPSGDGGAIPWGTDRPTAVKLDRIGRTAGATFQMTRLAAVTALIALEADAGDFVIGMPVSTRTRPQLQTMLGRFLNFSLVRLRLAGDPSFNRWLGEVRRAVIDAGMHTLIPAERLRRELDVELPPPAVRFAAWPGLAPMPFGDLKLESVGRKGERSAVFGIAINQAHEAGRCWAEFDPAHHDPSGVEQFVSRLQALIAAAAAEPGRSLRDMHAAIAVL